MNDGVSSKVPPGLRRSINFGYLVLPNYSDVESLIDKCLRTRRFSVLIENLLVARQPPYTKSQIREYFRNNNYISVKSKDVMRVSFSWSEQFYTWYQLQPSAVSQCYVARLEQSQHHNQH